MIGSKLSIRVAIALTIMGVFFTACQSDNASNENQHNESPLNLDEPFDFDEAHLLKVIVHKLNIDPNDATFSVHRAHLNEDEYLDAYVSVNLSKVASRDMEQAKNPASFVDMGYLGNYNYIVVWDGELKRISKPYVLASNGLEALKLFEQNILDPGYKTISAQYRVRNSAFEIFFRYLNGNIVPVFSYKIIDGIGTNNPEAYVYELQDNPSQLQRDFIIYEAIIPDYSLEEALKNTNYYPYDHLEKQQQSKRLRFFFEKSMQKYATNDAVAQ